MHFIDKWRAQLIKGDPYYNPNFLRIAFGIASL